MTKARCVFVLAEFTAIVIGLLLGFLDRHVEAIFVIVLAIWMSGKRP